MNEFTNRVEAQRSILQLVNSFNWPTEELFGLSSKAIDRWSEANRIERESRLLSLTIEVASKLSFLATKSQDQVSAAYVAASRDITALAEQIGAQIEVLRSSRQVKCA